jgi:hypothetical protein
LAGAAATASLSLSGTPVTGNNTYEVNLTVPSGDPAPSETTVNITDGSNPSCSATLTASTATVYVGSCTIDDEVAGETVTATYDADLADTNYSEATSNVLIVQVAAQAITFTSIAPSSPTVGGTYVVSATGGLSGNPVTFSIDGTSTAGACSITGPTVSLTGVGTCVIDANQAGDTNYSAASPMPQSFSIFLGQVITFTSSVPSSPTVGGTYVVSATGGLSGNPVTFSIDGTSTAGACSITGPTVSLTGVGTCVIDANQAGDTNYSAASPMQQSFSVLLGSQTITFTSSVPSSPTVGGTYVVSATGGLSGNPVTFSIDATSTTGACSITGPTVSLTGVGACVIDANQAGGTSLSAAPEVHQSFSIEAASGSGPPSPPGSQAITFTSSVPSSPTVGGTYVISATGGASGNPVTFSIDATSTAGACSITGPTVSLTGVGACVVDANQAGGTSLSAAPEVQQSFSVLLGSQAITFTSSVPSSPTVGGTYVVSATGGTSGNPVTFSIDATSTAGACSITGPTVSLTGTGTCVVDANQAASASYSAALEVHQSFSILLGQVITFTSSVPSSPTVGGTYVVSATGGASGNPVTFHIDAASTKGACTITGSKVSFTGTGTCVVDANQAGNANYSAAPEVHQSFAIRSALAGGPPRKSAPKIVINLDRFSKSGRTLHESVKLSCARSTCSGLVRSLGQITTTKKVSVKSGPWTITKKVTKTIKVVLTSAPYRLAKGKSGVLTLTVSPSGRSALASANVETPFFETLTATVKGGSTATKSTSMH